MNFFLRALTLTVSLCYAAVAPAQFALPADKLAGIPVLNMPAQDNAALLASELAARKPGRPEVFAVTIPTTIRPATHGSWTEEGNTAVWRTRISSPGARTLNLGFSEYKLPEGGELYLLTSDEKYGPYTAADNADHNQLWTPVLGGDELMVELRVPSAAKKSVQLYLTAVNHDFIDVRSKMLTEECNIDVICSEADGFGIIDNYRDIIRSVAAYTISGRATCTGFLVNNVNQDGTPLFMTAAHCRVDADNAPAIVTFWNYENSFCREVVLGSSGDSPGSDGSTSTTNSGAIWLATNVPSDMTILRLDQPVNPDAKAFFAGWSAEAEVPTDTMIAIHHPGVQEKRISFSFQDPFRNDHRGGPNRAATHLRIPFWDLGTTQGGSSGSPVFDRFKRVRGQLQGGRASCERPDEYDSYGYFHSSWEGSGTPTTRLRDWLDPCGTGTLTIDGFDSDKIPAILTAVNSCIKTCVNRETSIPFTLGGGYPNGTNLEITSASPAISTTLSATTVTGNETVNLIIPADAAAAPGAYEITVTATSPNFSDDITFSVNFLSGTASAPITSSPGNGVTGVNPVVTFVWGTVADMSGYDFQLSEDEDFADIIVAPVSLTGTNFTPNFPLVRNTTYYWRVRSVNVCGGGEWAASSFTTADLSCAGSVAGDLPVLIRGFAGEEHRISLTVEESFVIDGMLEISLDIDHTWIGDLDGRLLSPSGTEIQVFSQPGDGDCNATNMSLTFSDDATLDAVDFNLTCNSGPLGSSGTFKPLESFATFDGEDASGVWTLILTDNSTLDGGRIEAFNLSLCTTDVLPELSVRSDTQTLTVCQNSGESNLVLSLGADYSGNVIVTPDVNGQPLNNNTSFYNADAQTLEINFSSWALLGTGEYDLNLVVTDGDEITRTLTIPLVVEPNTSKTNLTGPDAMAEIQEGEVIFTWEANEDANGYLFQYSNSPDFAIVVLEVAFAGTTVSIADLPTGEPIFWRVLAEGNCGISVSDVRELRVIPTGIHDFGGGRSLSVYPNPVRRLLTVEATGSWPAGVRGLLFDATGRRLSSYRMANSGSDQWDLGTLPAGVYYLRFEGLGTQRTERLVVMP